LCKLLKNFGFNFCEVFERVGVGVENKQFCISICMQLRPRYFSEMLPVLLHLLNSASEDLGVLWLVLVHLNIHWVTLTFDLAFG